MKLKNISPILLILSLLIILVIICVIIYFIIKSKDKYEKQELKYKTIYGSEKQELNVDYKIQNYFQKFSKIEKENLLMKLKFLENRKSYFLDEYYETKYLTSVYTGDAGCSECVAVFKKFKITNKSEWESWLRTNANYTDEYILQVMTECATKFFDSPSICNKDDLIPEPPSPDDPHVLEQLIQSFGAAQGRWKAIKGTFSLYGKFLKGNLDELRNKGKEEGLKLLKSLYELLNKNVITEKDVQILLFNTGVGALNVALSFLGLGFAFGPLKDLIDKHKPDKASVSTLESDLKKAGYTDHDMLLLLGEINNALDATQNFLETYALVKYDDKVLCPTPSGCVIDDETGECDIDLTNKITLLCVKPNSSDNKYDPSIELNSLDRSSTNTKRKELFDLFTGPTSAIQKLISNPDHDYFKQIKNCSEYSLQIAISLYPTYLLLISNGISYYQELAEIDKQFKNPWESLYIGEPEKIGYKQEAGVIGFMQKTAIDSYEYIRRMFFAYSKTIDFTISHSHLYKSFMTDNCGLGKDGNIDSFLGDQWYDAIKKKYAEIFYGRIINIDVFYKPTESGIVEEWYDDFTKQYYMTKYLIYFNERLQFPLKDLMVYRVMAGFEDDFTCDDLFAGILYDIFYEPGFTKFYPSTENPNSKYPEFCSQIRNKNVCNILLPKKLDKSKMIHYNKSTGGYPFGLNSLSYNEGYSKISEYKNNKNTSIQDTNDINSYCTPILPVVPGNPFTDGNIFNNIPGDSRTYPDSFYCADPNADSVKSCLKAGSLPGDNDNRTAFCYNSKTNLASEILETKPSEWNKPTNPVSGYDKNWYLETSIFKNRLSLHSNGAYTYNGINLEPNSIVWQQTTMNFYLEGNIVDNFTVVFGENQQILGGKLGDYYFKSPVPFKLESTAKIPNIPLVGTDPKVRTHDGKASSCAYEYKIYSDNVLLDSGNIGDERPESRWVTFSAGSNLTFEARGTGIFKNGDWKRYGPYVAKRGYLYDFRQNCDCWWNLNDICFDLAITNNNPNIDQRIFDIRYDPIELQFNIRKKYHPIPPPKGQFKKWNLCFTSLGYCEPLVLNYLGNYSWGPNFLNVSWNEDIMSFTVFSPSYVQFDEDENIINGIIHDDKFDVPVPPSL
jgi:hypothetical protein